MERSQRRGLGLVAALVLGACTMIGSPELENRGPPPEGIPEGLPTAEPPSKVGARTGSLIRPTGMMSAGSHPGTGRSFRGDPPVAGNALR